MHFFWYNNSRTKKCSTWNKIETYFTAKKTKTTNIPRGTENRVNAAHAKTRQQTFHVEQMSTNDKGKGEYSIKSRFTDK